MILETAQLYMDQAVKGTSTMSEEIAQEFGDKCKKAILEIFNEHSHRKPTLRMSAVGKPLCQQQMAHSGQTPEPPWNGYAGAMQMLYGDVIEAAVIAVLKGAGVPIEGEDETVYLDVEGIKLKGTYDIKIDGNIYDIKSASAFQFDRKFNAPNAFERIRQEDNFGYITQGYGYAEADSSKFGGWIVVDKSTGRWTIATPPIADRAYRLEALGTIRRNVRSILDKAPFKRLFNTIDEKFNKKLTGNKVLGIPCKYCEYKTKCWEDKGIQLLEQPASKAAFPKKEYYIGEVKK